MKWQAAETLKHQIPLLDYAEGQGWKPVRRIVRGRLMGLCPLHADHKPSFLVDPNKNLFYCYGCGRGGDVIRFAELYHGVPFREAIALLRRWYGGFAAWRREQVLPGPVTSASRSGGLPL
jgi:DNA primase